MIIIIIIIKVKIIEKEVVIKEEINLLRTLQGLSPNNKPQLQIQVSL